MSAVEAGIRDLAREANFAAFTVLLRSGQPMTHVMWVDADDDHVLINTEVHRAKYQAVRRDPRVTVTIWKRDDPYRFAEVRGRWSTPDQAGGSGAHRRTLAEDRNREYDEANIGSERVTSGSRPTGSGSAEPGATQRPRRSSVGGRGATSAAP